MNLRLLFLLLLGAVLVPEAMAQSSGTVRLLVDPGTGFQFVVDKKHRMEQREVTLTEGLHALSVWAPERMVVDTQVFVVADRTSDLIVRLPYSPEYLEYRKETSKFERKKRWTRAAPLLATAGAMVWTIKELGDYRDASDRLEADRTAYELGADPANLDRLKDEVIPADKKAFKDERTDFYVATGVTLLGAAATYYVFRLTSQWERPLFEDKQKVLFEGLSWLPSDQGGLWAVQLSIPLH